MKSGNKGFTLIELLVVIAIIGILSSVVLASLNTARDKGEDAAKKANLNNIRAQAEIVYDDDGNYSSVCGDSTVSNAVTAASGTCFDSSEAGITTGWGAQTQLSDSTYFCVDYTGNSTTTGTSAVSNSDATCE